MHGQDARAAVRPIRESQNTQSPRVRFHALLTESGDPKVQLHGAVGSAHYVLGPFGSDSDLRRHGQKITSRGAKNAKKRAVVAVARKLCVLLQRLWVSGEIYDPLYNTHRRQEQEAA
jgi:hypothetical protein